MKVKLSINYFGKGHHYLAYQVAGGLSGFGIKIDDLQKAIGSNMGLGLFILKYKDELTDIPEDMFKAIEKTAFLSRNVIYRGVTFPHGVSDEMKDFFIENIGNTVQVQLKDGWEEFTDNPMDCGEDGKLHTYRIGVTCGKRKALIAVYPGEIGGGIICFKGIKSYRRIC